MAASNQLLLAHPDETKAKAKAAYEEHGSIRKAANAAGVPKSTVHRWVQTHKWGDPLSSDRDGQNQIEPVDSIVPSSTPPDGEDPAENDIPARQEEQQSNTDTTLDPTSNLPDPHDPLTDGTSPGALEELDQVQEGQTIPHRLYVEAIYRYTSLLANGVHPDRALAATKAIDPSFYVNPEDHRRIIQELEASGFDPNQLDDYMPDRLKASEMPNALLCYAGFLGTGVRPDMALAATQLIDPSFTLTMAENTNVMESIGRALRSGERLRMATILPPPYVRNTYDQYALGPDEQSSITDTLANMYRDAYTEAVNDQLSALGRDPIQAVNDPALLGRLQAKAEATAEGVVDTWNRDLANAVGQNWIDLSAQEGRQMSQVKLNDAIDAWQSGRLDSKVTTWTHDAAADVNAMALQDWQDNNGTVSMCRFVGGDTDEPICAELLAEYGDWTPIDEAENDFGSYPHPNCIHDWETQHNDVSPDQSLWTGTTS